MRNTLVEYISSSIYEFNNRRLISNASYLKINYLKISIRNHTTHISIFYEIIYIDVSPIYKAIHD